MKIRLSDHFTYPKLLRFILPSVAMMIFTSVYGVVDGYFVSNFVGKTPFAAVNFIMPFLMLFGGIGFMFGTGGSALVSKIMGEGRTEKANRIFSLIVYTSILVGVTISALGILFLRPVAALLGAEGELLESCVIYGRIILCSTPFFILQMEFQSFFVAAEKPQLGLWVTVFSGVTNMVLDALFIVVFQWGIVGAAVATATSQVVGGAVSLLYFFFPNSALLHLGKTRFDGAALWKTCTNGSSELMSNISMSLVGLLYNIQLMRYAGEDGVAAYGVLMYVNLFFLSVFIGYAIGMSPIVSFHYGAGNADELKNLLKKSLVIIGLSSVVMFLLSETLAMPLSRLFVGYDPSLFELTRRGFTLYSFSFLFAGMSIFSSSFFTALNNGLVSALISFVRTLVFQVGAVLLLPLIFDIDGVWLSIVAAELMAFCFGSLFIILFRKKYRY